MLHISIISVGKLKEKYWQEAENEYLKRLSNFAKINIIELKEESFNNKDNSETIKKKESEKITNALPKNTFLVILDKNTKQFGSVELAKKINYLMISQVSNITFIIGGPLGLDESIKKIANFKLSLSEMTFTHQMSRIILLEQIYRVYTILNNIKYHY